MAQFDILVLIYQSIIEYYVRTYFHLLNEVIIMELDINNMIIKEVGRNIA